MTAPNLDDWLGLVEEDVIDPQLPIIDPHHHLWEHPDNRYVAEDFLRDVASGHNVVQSVFVECMSMYRTSGPESFRPVGETDYVCQLAERSDAAGPESPPASLAMPI